MPLTYTPLVLKGLDLKDPNQLRAFQQQICDFLNAAFTASGISGFLNGPGLLNGNSISQVSVSSVTETTNRTVDTRTAQNISLNLSVTGAINYTLTLNNVVPGALISLRLINLSAATRTFSVLINNPSSVAYGTVALIGTGSPLIINGAGASIAANAAWNGFGTINFAANSIYLYGGVGT